MTFSLDSDSLRITYELAGGHRSPAVVGPWLPGVSLAQKLDPLWDRRALAQLARQLGDALDTVHRAGWVHGDLNPGNVLFTDDGRAVLTDFGSAQRIGERWERPDKAAVVEITPQTAAPEVWREQRAEAASDVYALAALLYRMLTSAFSFDAVERAETGKRHCDAPIPRAIGESIEQVLRRGLAKRAKERFGSGAEFVEELTVAVEKDARESVMRAVAERFGRFVDTLDRQERVAILTLIEGLETANATAWAEAEALITAVFWPGAALLALEESGAAAALADAKSQLSSSYVPARDGHVWRYSSSSERSPKAATAKSHSPRNWSVRSWEMMEYARAPISEASSRLRWNTWRGD